MNIFFIDADPACAARYLLDVHVGSVNCGGKMIIESAQMLANCYTPAELAIAPKTQTGKVRKYSHYNHPCSIWVRKSRSNFNWLLTHAMEMVREKVFRGGKTHFSSCFIDWCNDNPPTTLPDIGLTPPALAVKNVTIPANPDPVSIYRKFYVTSKTVNKNGKSMFSYTNRPVPDFWKEMQ